MSVAPITSMSQRHSSIYHQRYYHQPSLQKVCGGRNRAAVVGASSALAIDEAEGVTSTTKQSQDDEAQYVLQTYGRARNDVVFVRGEGCHLVDAEGRRYLDMAAGIAVNVLGHSDPGWVKSVRDQAGELCHVSNLYHTPQQATLARKLCESSFADRVFFCNSGAEANEGAIKFARKYARLRTNFDANWEQGLLDKILRRGPPTKFVSFERSFHGRTMGALQLTYKKQYKTPFAPLMAGGTESLPFGDLDAVARTLRSGNVAGVFVEPVQGEGGVLASDAAFLKGLRELCDETGALLIFDEVQCGLGRCGALWAHQTYDVEPDILTTAKPLAGGLPIGAVLMKQKVADAMSAGDHGSTFAGGPLVCAAANYVFDTVSAPAFLSEVQRKGDALQTKLRAKLEGIPGVVEVRGRGLLVGVQLDRPAGPVCESMRTESNVLAITAGAGDVLRLVPPLIISDAEIDTAVDAVAKAVTATA